jgi:hypothetical protein
MVVQWTFFFHSFPWTLLLLKIQRNTPGFNISILYARCIMFPYSTMYQIYNYMLLTCCKTKRQTVVINNDIKQKRWESSIGEIAEPVTTFQRQDCFYTFYILICFNLWKSALNVRQCHTWCQNMEEWNVKIIWKIE